MNILEKVKNFFEIKENKVQALQQKENDSVGSIISPVFKEIPPDSKSGKFLTEGLRSWAFIAISAIADEIATTEISLYKKVGSDWLDQENHKALKLIEKPNNFQTKEDFLWLTVVYWLSEGEAPIYLNSPKNPTEMVLLNPERLTLEFDDKNIIGKYIYRQSDGKRTIIPAENMLMLKIPSVYSPFRGTGLMRYIAQTLDIDNYIDEYVKLFFYNDTTPGAVLETEQELNKNIVERLKNQFRNRHQGVKNSHKLAILEKGMKYKKTSSNINELQLKELNDLIRDKVLACFRVPKSVLGIVEDVNRSNAEASSYTFSKRCIEPKVKMIQGQLNQFLLPRISDSDNLWFEFENVVDEDKLVNAQINEIGVRNGWLTKNEVRETMGLDPLEEDEADEPKKEDPKKRDDDEEEENEEDKKEPKKRIREKKRPDTLVEIMKDILEEEKPNPKKFYTETELVDFHKNKIMFTGHIESNFINELNIHFRRQKRTILKQLEGKATKSNKLNLLLDFDSEVLSMIKIASPFLFEAIQKESELTYALLGLRGGLTPLDSLVRDFVNTRTLKLGEETTKTSQEAIDNIIKKWSEDGKSTIELRKELEEYFDGTGEVGAKARASMIARTETTKATGFAQQEVYKETGAISKQWLTAVDEKVCEWCNSMNDKYGNGMVVGIEENFFDKGDIFVNSEGKQMSLDWENIDTPPLHPNCRCDIIPVYAESKSLNNKAEIKKAMIEKKEKFELEQKRLQEIEDRELLINKKEFKLIEKEENLAKEEEKQKKLSEELKKEKEKTKKELKELEDYNKKLNGKVKST
jgi:HK97 family phage portal protein